MQMALQSKEVDFCAISNKHKVKMNWLDVELVFATLKTLAS